MDINLIYIGNRNFILEEDLANLAKNYKGSLGLFQFFDGEYLGELYIPENTLENFITDAKILIKKHGVKLNIFGTWYSP